MNANIVAPFTVLNMFIRRRSGQNTDKGKLKLDMEGHRHLERVVCVVLQSMGRSAWEKVSSVSKRMRVGTTEVTCGYWRIHQRERELGREQTHKQGRPCD